MTQEVMDLIRNSLDAQGIQFLFFYPPYKNLTEIDYQLRKNICKNFDYKIIQTEIEKSIQPGTARFFRDDFRMNYCIFYFPEELQESWHCRYCLIGPVLFHPITAAEFQSFVERFSVPQSLYRDFQEFFNRVPLTLSLDSWIAYLTPMIKAICGEDVVFSYSDHPETQDIAGVDYEYTTASCQQTSLRALEDRYKAEALMMEAVATGNVEKALECYHKFLQFKLAPRVADPLRDRKNLLITQNTLLRKAAQAGYVHPLHIDNLSSQLAIQIEACTSVRQLEQLSVSMIRKYCLLVKNYSRKSYSRLVQTCLDYIDFHYQDDLSLNYMAQFCSVTNGYLSAQFKKETGSTLTDYLNSTRIRQSLILLNSTRLSVQDIAFQCGFSDSNYFTRIFKKRQGCSPKQYRDMIR